MNIRVELINACVRGNLRKLNKLLEDPHAVENLILDNNADFKWAVKNGHHLVVRRLLEIPDILHFAISNAFNILYDAIYYERLKVINCILEIPTLIEHLREDDGWILLKNAIKYPKIFDRLLEIPVIMAGATNTNNFRYTILFGDLDILDRLLKIPEVVEQIDGRIFIDTISRGNKKIIMRLLDVPKVIENINAYNNEAIRSAINYGHLDIVYRLLEFPAVVRDITKLNNIVFHGAECVGYLDLANRLLEFPHVREMAYKTDSACARRKRKEMYEMHMKVLRRFIGKKFFCIRVDKFRYRPQFFGVNGLLRQISAKFAENSSEK